MSATFSFAGSIAEAVGALAEGARPVAGGTDLVVGARQGKAPLPGRIVAVDRIESLRGIEQGEGRLRLGALELVRIQPAGGKPMAAADWLRGRQGR